MSIILARLLRRSYRFDRSSISLLLTLGVIEVSTVLNGGAIFRQLSVAGSWFFLFVGVSSSIRLDSKAVVIALRNLFGILLFLNLVTVLADGDALFLSDTGMRNWFLGDRNAFAIYVICGLVCSLLADHMLGKRHPSTLSVFIYGVGLVSVIRVWSATSVVVLVLLGAIIVVNCLIPTMRRLLTMWSVVGLWVSLFVGVVLLNMTSLFGGFITQDLGKDITLSGRVGIWSVILSRIGERPWFGHGLEDEMMELPTWNGVFPVVHAHNLILQILMLGGVVAVVLFGVFVLSCLGRLNRVDDSVVHTLLLAAFAVLSVEYTFDFLQVPAVVVLFAFSSDAVSLIGPRISSTLALRKTRRAEVLI